MKNVETAVKPQGNSVKKGNAKGGKKGAKEVVKPIVPAKMAKRTIEQIQKTELYDASKAGSFDAFLQAGRDADLENLSFGKKINHFLDVAKVRLSEIGVSAEKLELMTFGNVKKFKDESERYAHLEYVSTHQAKLIVNGYLKSIDGNIARGERVAKQGGVTGKQADKMTRNSAK